MYKMYKKVFLQGKISGRLVYNESILSAAQGDISNTQKKCDFRDVIFLTEILLQINHRNLLPTQDACSVRLHPT